MDNSYHSRVSALTGDAHGFSDEDDSSDEDIEKLMGPDEGQPTGAIHTRAAFESKSTLLREKSRKKKKKSSLVLKDSENGKASTSESKVVPKTGSANTKGILKNKYSSKRNLQENSMNLNPVSSNSNSLDAEDKKIETDPLEHKMMTNVQLKSWSVASFDSCGGDTRRTYANYLLLNAKSKFGNLKGFTVFKNKTEETCEIAKHEGSNFEDDEPFGPHDSDSYYYNKQRPLPDSKSRKSKLKSFTSWSSAKRSRSSKLSKKGSNLGSRISLLSKIFNKKGDSDSSARPHKETKDQLSDFYENDAVGSESVEKVKNILKLKKANSGLDFKLNDPPNYIPPDMEWDPDFHDGRGGLVNREPKYIPRGKIWSREANGGKGMLVNKPLKATLIPPGKIWSRFAFNGMGGVVNKKPKKIPKNTKWDYEACEGMGGLVDLSPEELKLAEDTIKRDRIEKKDQQERIHVSAKKVEAIEETEVTAEKVDESKNLKSHNEDNFNFSSPGAEPSEGELIERDSELKRKERELEKIAAALEAVNRDSFTVKEDDSVLLLNEIEKQLALDVSDGKDAEINQGTSEDVSNNIIPEIGASVPIAVLLVQPTAANFVQESPSIVLEAEPKKTAVSTYRIKPETEEAISETNSEKIIIREETKRRGTMLSTVVKKSISSIRDLFKSDERKSMRKSNQPSHSPQTLGIEQGHVSKLSSRFERFPRVSRSLNENEDVENDIL